ncbi:hypothetical protein M8J75_014377 [Diaphorina citri]|nr:hypothetical protein M8J75_014377 [Diaphorina citri]
MAKLAYNEDIVSYPSNYLTSNFNAISKSGNCVGECPMCNKLRKTFYCKVCISDGDFLHSTSHYAERYAEKKIALLYKIQEKENLVSEFNERNEINEKVTSLASNIHECRERIRLTKYCIKEVQERLLKRKEKLNHIKEENKKYSSRLPSFGKKMLKYENYIKEQKNKLSTKQNQLERVQNKIKHIARINMKQLIEYIFPITIVQPAASQEEEDLDTTVSAIAEAARTNYLKGEWIYTDTSSEVQYCIIAPTLPGSRDYSQYNYWVKANRDGAADTYEQAAYSISGALTYTTQLTSILAFFLDVRLPHKLNYSEFCGNELSERKFSKKVSWLNMNILHLCLSQNISLDSDLPMHPLHYILALLRTDKQSTPSRHTDMSSEVADSILEQMCLPSISTGGYRDSDSEDEEEESEATDWENIGLLGCPGELSAQMSRSAGVRGDGGNTSMAGGLVTSAAASIVSMWRWRGFTSRR